MTTTSARDPRRDMYTPDPGYGATRTQPRQGAAEYEGLRVLGDMPDINIVLECVEALRLQPVAIENDIHSAVQAQLTQRRLPYKHEVRLAPRCRIDYVVGGGVDDIAAGIKLIGIEIKKGKPNGPSVRAQVERYCKTGTLKYLILVVERSAANIPSNWTENGVDVTYVGLNKLWGIAV